MPTFVELQMEGGPIYLNPEWVVGFGVDEDGKTALRLHNDAIVVVKETVEEVLSKL